MKGSRLSVFLVAICAAAVLASLSGCTYLKARDELNKGVQSYTNAQYPEAVEHFKTAVELDPDFHTARLYLATAYMSQYIPGAASEENLRMASMAEDEFQKVLAANPDPESTKVAIASIASLYFHKEEFDAAEEWNRKLIAADPEYKEAYYTLGVIAWSRTYPKAMEARAELGMMPEDPRPLTDDKVREELRQTDLPIIENGIQMLEKALDVDPEYDDAMAYLNLLYRRRADLANSQEDYDRDIELANDWVDKSMATKKIKAARSQQASFGLETE